MTIRPAAALVAGRNEALKRRLLVRNLRAVPRPLGAARFPQPGAYCYSKEDPQTRVVVCRRGDIRGSLFSPPRGPFSVCRYHLSEEKTRVCHLDEGFDFLGWRIQRRRKRGHGGERVVYTYPSKKALASVKGKVRSLTRRHKHRTLADLLRAVNPLLRGWCVYFRHGVSSRTFQYVDHFAWWRTVGWLRKRHVGLNWGTLRRRHLPRWEIRDGDTELFRPRTVPITRYRYRGTRIPTPWTSQEPESSTPSA